jgi:hypothetical protein
MKGNTNLSVVGLAGHEFFEVTTSCLGFLGCNLRLFVSRVSISSSRSKNSENTNLGVMRLTCLDLFEVTTSCLGFLGCNLCLFMSMVSIYSGNKDSGGTNLGVMWLTGLDLLKVTTSCLGLFRRNLGFGVVTSDQLSGIALYEVRTMNDIKEVSVDSRHLFSPSLPWQG